MSGSTDSIVTALVTQFTDQLHITAQQNSTKLKGKIIERPVKNANIMTYDSLGNLEAMEVTERHSATTFGTITHSRRQVAMRDFRATLPFDDFDKLQMLVDPSSEYSRAVVKALYREYDILALKAALASVATGRNGETTLTAAADGVDTVGDGSVALNYDTILSIKEGFFNSDVGIENDEQIVIPITGRQWSDLMKEEEFTSNFFMGTKPVMDGLGVISSMPLGITFVMFEGNDTKYLPKATTIRTIPVFAKRGICMGVNRDITVTINQRPDLNNLWQVQALMWMNAVRSEGKLVKKVLVKES